MKRAQTALLPPCNVNSVEHIKWSWCTLGITDVDLMSTMQKMMTMMTRTAALPSRQFLSSTAVKTAAPSFGIAFDIDGVLIRCVLAAQWRRQPGWF